MNACAVDQNSLWAMDAQYQPLHELLLGSASAWEKLRKDQRSDWIFRAVGGLLRVRESSKYQPLKRLPSAV